MPNTSLQQTMRKALQDAKPIDCDPNNVIEDFVKASEQQPKNKKSLE